MRTTVTLVIPAFQEASGLGDSLRTLDDAFSKRPDLEADIVLVDDGSTDETLAVAQAVAPTLTCPVTILSHRLNQGLGGALRSGLAASTGEIVTTVDSDLSYGVDDLIKLIDTAIATGAHVVMASPYMPGGRSIGVPRGIERRSRIANKVLGWAALDNLHTLTGMVRAYDGAHIRALSLKAVDVDINSEILYKTQLLRGSIIEVPATLDWSHLPGRGGRTNLLSNRSRWNTAKSLVNAFLFRPFLFPLFPIPVLLLLALGLVFVDHWLAHAMLEIFLIISTMLVLASLFALQLKRYFEETYSLLTRQGVPIDHPRHAVVVMQTAGQRPAVEETTELTGTPPKKPDLCEKADQHAASPRAPLFPPG